MNKNDSVYFPHHVHSREEMRPSISMARKNLNAMQFIGILDYMPESLCMLKHFLSERNDEIETCACENMKKFKKKIVTLQN